MCEMLEARRSDVLELCRRYRVKTLEVFGSAADGKFDPNKSDLDFLVDFEPMNPGDHSESYFDLWFALQDLFGREVDLVETKAVSNPYFIESIRLNRRLLYAA